MQPKLCLPNSLSSGTAALAKHFFTNHVLIANVTFLYMTLFDKFFKKRDFVLLAAFIYEVLAFLIDRVGGRGLFQHSANIESPTSE